MEVQKYYLTNEEKYPWIRLNPNFAITKRENTLKWGNTTARLERETCKTMRGEKLLAVISFFYNKELVKTYKTTQKPTTPWVSECILDYFDSRELDKIIKEPSAGSYALMLKKYNRLTQVLDK